MLPCSCLSNDACFSHAFSKQRLSKGVVYFVGSSMRKVFAFKVDFCSAEFACEVLGVVERCCSPREFGEVVVELLLERRVSPCVSVGSLKLSYGFHEDFGDKASTVLAIFPI